MDAKGLDCSISQIRNGLEWVNKNKNTHTPGQAAGGKVPHGFYIHIGTSVLHGHTYT